MSGDMAIKPLPEELVVKIVAMMPFPSIFKARLLSKSWQARFQSIQSQVDLEQKSRAMFFQKLVTESANRWGTFCHACVPEEGSIIGLDQTLRTRVMLPSLSFLPEKVFQVFLSGYRFDGPSCLGGDFLKGDSSYLQIEGPLLYGMLKIDEYGKEEVYVANILTQECKKLPARPRQSYNLDHVEVTICCVKLVMETSGQAYKLIVICNHFVCLGHGVELSVKAVVQIYDSKARTWSSHGAEELTELRVAPYVSSYFNGILYMSNSYDMENLIAYNLEERSLTVHRLSTWTGLPVLANDTLYQNQCRLVVCDGSLMMIVTEYSEFDGWDEFEDQELESCNVRVLKIDIESKLVREVAHWPLAANKFTDIPVSEDNYIFFGTSRFPHLMVAYDECNMDWSSVFLTKARRMCSIAFQPGLHTFMAV